MLDSNLVYRISLLTKITSIVIGSLPECEYLKKQDGSIISSHPLIDAKAIAVSPDSTLYIAETNSKRLNQVIFDEIA